jgi:hypothetical protein
LSGLFNCFALGDDSDAFLGSISQTDKRTRRLCGIPDRVADFGRARALSGLSHKASASLLRDFVDDWALSMPALNFCGLAQS